MAVFGFPADGKVHSLVVDLSRTMNRFGVKDAELKARGKVITGWVKSGGFCAKANDYRVYFALESEEMPARTCTFDALGVGDVEERTGSHIGGCMSFAAAVREVHVRVGLSYVSADAAAANLRAEIGDWDIAKLRAKGTAVWNEALARAEVMGGTAAQRRVYYTALYHSLLHPSLFSDADGRYIGFDDKVHTLAAGRRQYANFSEWDIYRSQVQLVAMLFPDVASDIAQSLVNDGKEGGGLPRWPLANDDSEVMVGDPADIILAEIYDFGARNFDAKGALALMIRGADEPGVHARLYLERHELEDYLSNGYVAETSHSEGSASMTLEYANADFAISRMAAEMGDATTAARMLERSGNWRKLFDAETRYIRPRGEDGKFLGGFTPGSGKGFVEGNSAQYTWMIPYDFAGVIKAIGGDAAANARLDDYFSQYGRWGGGPYFLLSNEPSFSNPWIYNWTGEPWRTDEVVSKTLKDLFDDSPGGIPGNDDVGATSAWAVFAELGIYPAIPGVAGFTLNTPMFPEARLKIGGKTVRIVADGSGAYVGGVSLGGKAVTNYWVSWGQFSSADIMTFHLTSERAVMPLDRPPSFAGTEAKANTGILASPE